MFIWWIGLQTSSLAVEPGVDTGAPSVDTGAPEASPGDSGAPVRPAVSASELAGEEGGCRCSSSVGSGGPAVRRVSLGTLPSGRFLVPLVALVVAARRRA